MLSKFRVDYSQSPDHPAFETLIAELTDISPIFRRLWNSADVMSRSEGVGHYPQLGGVRFEHSSYVPEGSPTLRVVVYVPHDPESATKIAEWRARRAENGAPKKH